MTACYRPSAPLRLRTVLLAALGMPLAALVSTAAFAQPAPAPGPAPASVGAAPMPNGRELVEDGVRTVLSQYGSFVTHPKYGEVWVPTITPRDWHPYLACHWVNSRKYGWFYDDRTPWGAIVHHYGRWAHDPRMGWIWAPGAEFSPGWVSWRTSPDYVGWAPLPPNEDVVPDGVEAFNNGGFWTFVETVRFDRGCDGAGPAPEAQIPTLLQTTQAVTDVTFGNGIAMAVLPAYVVGPLVDITIAFKPWPHAFFNSTLFKWNMIWNVWDVKTTVNFVDCAKRPPRRLSPPVDPCGRGIVDPSDGRCAGIADNRPPLPPACGKGLVRQDNGRCAAPPLDLPPQDPGPPPATDRPGPDAVPMIIPPLPRCAAGQTRERDGRCRATVVVPVPPPSPPSIRTEGPCRDLVGVAFRRCIDHRPVLVERRPPPPPRPVVQVPVNTRPIVQRPVAHPRPVFHPTPAYRPHPRPAVFHPRPVVHPRPAFHPRPVVSRRPAFHPRPTVRRPVVHRPAPSRPAPRGNRRRR